MKWNQNKISFKSAILIITLIVFFINVIPINYTYASEKETEKKNELTFHLGFGNIYSIFGIAAEYSFFNQDLNHISFLFSASYVGVIGATSTLRYGIGNINRIIFDVSYGISGLSASTSGSIDEYGNISESESDPKAMYDPSVSIGYQKLFENNIVFTINLSLLRFEDGIGGKPFIIVPNIGIGYRI